MIIKIHIAFSEGLYLNVRRMSTEQDPVLGIEVKLVEKSPLSVVNTGTGTKWSIGGTAGAQRHSMAATATLTREIADSHTGLPSATFPTLSGYMKQPQNQVFRPKMPWYIDTTYGTETNTLFKYQTPNW